MLHWLATEWPAVRQNLEAAAIWATPGYLLGIWHHRHVRHSLASLHRKIDESQHPAGRHTRG